MSCCVGVFVVGGAVFVGCGCNSLPLAVDASHRSAAGAFGASRPATAAPNFLYSDSFKAAATAAPNFLYSDSFKAAATAAPNFVYGADVQITPPYDMP